MERCPDSSQDLEDSMTFPRFGMKISNVRETETRDGDSVSASLHLCPQSQTWHLPFQSVVAEEESDLNPDC